MAKTIFISDERMLQLMSWAINNDIAKDETDYLSQIEFVKNNLEKVRNGTTGFTKRHILNASVLTGANINWIFGLESNMMRKPNKSIIVRLKEITTELEAQKRKI